MSLELKSGINSLFPTTIVMFVLGLTNWVRNKSWDKSLFPTTIVMFVLGSINEVRSREHGGEMRAAK